MKGHSGSGGQRSNMYSESKCSNWRAFDPFESEISTLPLKQKPDCYVEVAGEELRIPIYVRETHPSFLRACEGFDIKETLEKVPGKYLQHLRSITLLAGTNKQAKVSEGSLFRYGCYGWGEIYLHAYPKRILSELWKNRPKPSRAAEYRKAGAVFESVEGGWRLNFSKEALRNFYLNDVLLHELGHHVERIEEKKKDHRSSERFADWFASFASSHRIQDSCD